MRLYIGFLSRILDYYTRGDTMSGTGLETGMSSSPCRMDGRGRTFFANRRYELIDLEATEC